MVYQCWYTTWHTQLWSRQGPRSEPLPALRQLAVGISISAVSCLMECSMITPKGNSCDHGGNTTCQVFLLHGCLLIYLLHLICTACVNRWYLLQLICTDAILPRPRPFLASRTCWREQAFCGIESLYCTASEVYSTGTWQHEALV